MKRTIRVLHVEDDPMQRALTRHLLTRLAEFNCEITGVEGEANAVLEFREHPHDLVLIDFQLAEGNGLSCVRNIRALSPHVPILAVSGEATPTIAAELLRDGADDYIDKRELNGDDFASRVRMAVARADAFRRRSKHRTVKTSAATIALVHLCREFLRSTDRRLVENLRDVETAAREAHLTPEQVPFLFDAADAELTGVPADAHLRLRPLLLELQYRLSSNRLDP